MKTSTPKPNICYLCGDPLTKPTSRDHVPPKQFYAEEIRKLHNPDLLTIRVHSQCNRAYQHDEDYFVNTLLPLVQGSYSGDALLGQVVRTVTAGGNSGLVRKVLGEFDRQPSGIALPPGLIAKRIEGARVHRVAWKIVRGLYFHHFQKLLPETMPNRLEVVPPHQCPPREFYALPADPIRGQHPGVLDYRFAKFQELNNFNYWALLLWDRLILTMSFHDPECTCEYCLDIKGGNSGAGPWP